MVFISILLEAFPFIMLGVVISSLIHVLVSEESIQKLMPKNIFLGSVVGALMGFLFPVCDCAVIPVARRLMKKGVPIHTGTAFMLAAPIVNPVVLIATAYAFKNILPQMDYLRTVFGLLIAIIIGIILGTLIDKKDVIKNETHDENHNECCSCCHNEMKNEEQVCEHHHGDEKNNLWYNIEKILKHSYEEFFEVGKYLIIGAAIAAVVQTFIPREIVTTVGKNPILSIIIMIAFAYLLSLCSTSDSFVAKTFVGQFTNSSILAFLLVGPMIDIKNTIMMFGNFKAKYVYRLIFLVFLFCYGVSLIAGYLLF